MGNQTLLHANPFHLLGVSTRDSNKRIIEAAEERSLVLEHEICQQARADLINPRTRLAAEIAWLPGVAPSAAVNLVASLAERSEIDPLAQGLPSLAHANILVAFAELIDDRKDTSYVARFIVELCQIVDAIDPDEVLRDINEDRSVSGFAEVRSIDIVSEKLAERSSVYLRALLDMLNRVESTRLAPIMTEAVKVATKNGECHGPLLLDQLIDRYETEAHEFLSREHENLTQLADRARRAASSEKKSLPEILGDIEKVSRNWDKIVQPVQISCKSRGIEHRHSRDVATELRSLAVDLFNDHNLLDEADRLTKLLRELFEELPEISEQLGEDATALNQLRKQAERAKAADADWNRTITFKAEVGAIFKEPLQIGPDGIKWNSKTVPLERITRLRWGGVRNSINGIPTGTSYTIGYGDNQNEYVINLRSNATYSGFIGALWPAVGVRLMIDIMEALSKGQSFPFGNMIVRDESVTLTRKKLFGSDEMISLSWGDVTVWSADGHFFIGKSGDRKWYGSASYIDTWNVHVLEQIVRGGFKKGIVKLSDLLRR